MDSSNVIGGSMYGTREASMLFPVPGGPISSTLCSPAAAISNAFFADSCPFTSEKSSGVSQLMAKKSFLSNIIGINRLEAVKKWLTSWRIFCTG